MASRRPRWPWFTMLQQMSTVQPLQLPTSPDMLLHGLIWHPHSDLMEIERGSFLMLCYSAKVTNMTLAFKKDFIR